MKQTMSTLIVTAVLIASGTAASAQSIGGAVYATYGTTSLASSDTFEAAAGTSRESGPGIGGTITGLWRGAFVDVAFTQYKLTAQRLFIDQGTVYSLGIPMRITMRPIDLVGGWRFQQWPRVSPYGGAGLVVMSYREEGDFSAAGEDVSERQTGAVVLAGADVRVMRLISVGAEFRYRAIQGVLGAAGASQIFGEDQLGGVAFAARVTLGR